MEGNYKMKKLKTVLAIFMAMLAFACNYAKYTPTSQKEKRRALPSVVLLNSIVEFRNEFHSWPLSKEDMASKGIKYKTAWDGFAYKSYSFKAKDTNTMTFNFWDYPKELENNKNDNRVELNSYNGWVKFYKEGDVFAWKINKN